VTVRKAVEKAETAAVERAKAPTLAQVAEQSIQAHAGMLDAVLPAQVDRRRFAQMAIQACRQAPDLAACFGTKQGAASFLLAVGQAAMVGLEPNTPTQDCWILPRKAGKVQEAQLTIGYRGIMRLARRSGTLRSIVAEVVREHDTFDYGYGQDGPYLEWKPAEERGELTHAFAIAWTKDGGRAQMVLSRAQVEDRRASSDSWRNTRSRPYSPWTNWPEAMWRKSAIRALAPYLDLTVEAETVLHRDEHRLTYDPSAEAIDVSETFAALGTGDEGQAADDGPEDAAAPAVDADGVVDTTAAETPKQYAPDDPERPM
jgi:recombination protein RecT